MANEYLGYDVRRLWEALAPTEETVWPEKSRQRSRTQKRTPAEIISFRAPAGPREATYGSAVERRCRAAQQSKAILIADSDPTSAGRVIRTILKECAACRRCVGL